MGSLGFIFKLLQVAIGNQKELPRQLTDDEWENLYSACEMQLVLGFTFSGIQKLPEEQMPPAELLAKWKQEAQEEVDRRKAIVKICKEACETHERNGFHFCVLMPRFAQVRDERLEVRGGDPRDIDILCWSKDKKNGKRTIVEYVNFQYVSSTKHIKPKVVRQHVDWKSGHIPIDVQLRTSLLNNPWHNKRYVTWRREMVEKTSKSDSCELTVEFYLVYQLMHLYKRFFCEDLRFGHLLEYYYTLREFKDEGLEVRDKSLEIIGRLGMKKFAGAVMYVLQTVFAMPDEYLLCKPDVRHGSFLLKMTNLAGEYGRAYERTRTLSHLGKIGRYLYWIKRNKPFITQYPSEMLFETYRKIVG